MRKETAAELDEMERLLKLAVKKHKEKTNSVVNEAEALARSARQSSAGMPAVRPALKPTEALTGKFATIRKF